MGVNYDKYVIRNETGITIDSSSHLDEEDFTQAVKNNDPAAMFLFGTMCDARRQYGLAASFFNKAAQKSYGPAEHYLGLMCIAGDGVEKNANLGKFWIAKAAMDGESTSAYFLGSRYDSSQDPSIALGCDDNISMFWYMVGAKMGNGMCMNNAGVNLLDGVGIGGKPDNMGGLYWKNKAATVGNENAKSWLKRTPKAAWPLGYIRAYEIAAFEHKTMTFGCYYNKDRKKKEPIEWIVLCKYEDGATMLLAKQAIATMNYYEKDCTRKEWAYSKVRDFLNNDFLYEAFSQEERKLLIPRNSVDLLNPVYETHSGGHNSDYVTIPSSYDLAFLINMDEWVCSTIPAGKVIINKGVKYDPWWLRDSGEPGSQHSVASGFALNDYYQAQVDEKGRINFKGMGATVCACGVRPLIIINSK